MGDMKAKTVDAYIGASPKAAQPLLTQLRKIIKTTAPAAKENISYGMPYYSYKGRLAYFGRAKTHVGLYAMPLTLAQHEKEIKKYRTGKATLRFSFGEKLPVALIKKLIKTGMKQNEQKKK
jgi:uncharacterized protein YdhG (YjbR/CyaY superfamily)